jgi:predicted dehydrogenase/threonine dehydrogenase-like Zn-dependent dehydrogenase
MRQILQHLRTGQTELASVAAPTVERGSLLIRTTHTLVSIGTEKMLVQFGRASFLKKVQSQPERVRQVIQKIKTDGLLPTLEAVFRKLDEPLPLGYCNSGVVIGIGEGVTGFQLGDRVASNGPHAEIVSVPANLAARIPDGVKGDAAAFTVVGAIGLQGLRLAKPELGETFVVIGLGLIGQIVGQLLRANGCRVIGFDYDPAKVAMAQRFGVAAHPAGGESDVVKTVLGYTSGLGADGVIITASTSSNEVISQSAHMCRKRGRIVLVGVVGLNLNRSDFYDKELSFQVSCSYGPGRYEHAYEEKGYDYPPGFVRWTENRNFQAVLEAMNSGALQIEPLITRRSRLGDYLEIYNNMADGGLGSLLVYDEPPSGEHSTSDAPQILPGSGNTGGLRADATIQITIRKFEPADRPLAIVGAGNFTKMTAMPALAAAAAPVKMIVSSGGVTGTSLARKYGIPYSTTDYNAVLSDAEIRGVIIATRHNLHAEQTTAALRAGKHVLVEKPLCLRLDELRAVENALAAAGSGSSSDNPKPWVTVGYNRRFSPHVEKMKALLNGSAAPISVVATMNAGAIPLNHWVHDLEVGGGRLVGEACHFVDLAIHLTGSLVTELSATLLDGASDCASILLCHENGSTSVVNYFAHGHRELSKERVEAHGQGRSLLLDNFRELRGYGFRSFKQLKTRQDKGHAKQFSLFFQRVKDGGPTPIPWAEIANSTRATLAIPIAIAEQRWVRVSEL